MEWHQQVRAELTALIQASAEEKTVLWEMGEPRPGVPIEHVTDDFVGEQYAPWYEGEVWRGESASWLEGTLQAARDSKGQGYYWQVDHIHGLPRSPEEGAVMYEIMLGKQETGPVAKALFLETWIKQEGIWHLKRHRAEKARC